MFTLNPRLEADTLPIADWALCRVLLMNDCRYPWVILVPRRPDLRDFDMVDAADKAAFYSEIERASRLLRAITGAHKMNVAALGNVVPQLHVHVVARFEGDAAWPAPVWGVGAPVGYEPAAAEALIGRWRTQDSPT